jgi:hypothetical protein
MKNVHKVPVSLSANQYRTLVKGGKIRLKHSQLNDEGPHTLHLTSSVKARKLQNAKNKNKGVELSLSPEEFSATVEGEGFKDFSRKANRWFKKKAAPWLSKAAKSVWSGVKDASNLAKHAAYALTDATAEALPAVAPVLAQGAMSYYMPQTALPQMAMARPMYGYGVRNPADNLEDNVDVGLFGIHNHTPDHVLMNNNSNFISAKHPAAQPTLLQQDPLASIHLGPVISGTGASAEQPNVVHPALQPIFNPKANLRNTPYFMHGGSFVASGHGFKPSGDY